MIAHRHPSPSSPSTGTAPSNRILTNRHIKLRYIRKPWSVPEGLPKIFYLLWAPFKALFVGAQLLLIMGGVTQYPNFVFVQVSIFMRVLPSKTLIQDS